jgi:hypothetical protein
VGVHDPTDASWDGAEILECARDRIEERAAAGLNGGAKYRWAVAEGRHSPHRCGTVMILCGYRDSEILLPMLVLTKSVTDRPD